MDIAFALEVTMDDPILSVLLFHSPAETSLFGIDDDDDDPFSYLPVRTLATFAGKEPKEGGNATVASTPKRIREAA